jgi:hypothetical protein
LVFGSFAFSGGGNYQFGVLRTVDRDPKNPAHKNVEVLYKLWLEIAEEFGEDVK